MLTGEIRNQVDRIWDAFWSGGISNPLEVIEQITYLLFIRRLDDLHTLEENKANRLKQPMERRDLPGGQGRPRAGPTRTCAGRASSTSRPPRCSPSSASTSSRSCARLGGDGLHLRAPHEGRALHHPHAGAAGQGGGHARPRADGGPRHQGRPLRVHARQDRHRRAERPVPHAAPHHPADGRDDRAAAERRHLRPGLRHRRLPGRGGRVPARAPPEDPPRREAARAFPPSACSTASTSTTRCCASAA